LADSGDPRTILSAGASVAFVPRAYASDCIFQMYMVVGMARGSRIVMSNPHDRGRALLIFEHPKGTVDYATGHRLLVLISEWLSEQSAPLTRPGVPDAEAIYAALAIDPAPLAELRSEPFPLLPHCCLPSLICTGTRHTCTDLPQPRPGRRGIGGEGAGVRVVRVQRAARCGCGKHGRACRRKLVCE
jgi:hypothetical protein